MSIIFDTNKSFEYSIPVIVVGSGGCGLSAALAVKETGTDVWFNEDTTDPQNTAKLLGEDSYNNLWQI